MYGKFVLLAQKSCIVGFCDLKLGEPKKSGQEDRRKGDRARMARVGKEDFRGVRGRKDQVSCGQ